MSDPIEIILIIALLAYVLVRRVAGQPAQGKRLLVLPAIMLIIGLTTLSHSWTPLGVGFVAASTLVTVIFGILRGLSIRLFEKDGIVWMRYTRVTVTLWISNIALKVAAAIVLAFIDPAAAHDESSGILLRLGVGVLLEGLIVIYRAVHSDSRVLWASGRKGEPDRHFDELGSAGRNDSERPLKFTRKQR